MSEHKPTNGNGVARVNLWIGIGTGVLFFLAPIVGGAWWLANLDSRVHSLEQNTPTVLAAASEKLVSLDRRVSRTEGSIAKFQGDEISNCQIAAKIETQFGTVETIMNKTQAGDLRDIALLWQKSYGQEYPNVFYPIQIPHEIMPC